MSAPKLVIGANGFLGSHVTRQLIAAGADVRAMVRPTANTRSIDDLDVVTLLHQQRHFILVDVGAVRGVIETAVPILFDHYGLTVNFVHFLLDIRP